MALGTPQGRNPQFIELSEPAAAVPLAEEVVRGCRGFTCRFAAIVHKGELVMSCARLAWSALLPLMSQPAERQRARDPVSTLVGCITATTDKKKHKTSEVGPSVTSSLELFSLLS